MKAPFSVGDKVQFTAGDYSNRLEPNVWYTVKGVFQGKYDKAWYIKVFGDEECRYYASRFSPVDPFLLAVQNAPDNN